MLGIGDGLLMSRGLRFRSLLGDGEGVAADRAPLRAMRGAAENRVAAPVLLLRADDHHHARPAHAADGTGRPCTLKKARVTKAPTS